MEEWVAEWLNARRKEGERCLEIKYIQGHPYVYHSTSVYDKEKKCPRKVSKYIGRLYKDHGVVRKGETVHDIAAKPRSVVEHGNAMLLKEVCNDLIEPLQKSFPAHWEEILGLSLIRVGKYVPLKRVQDEWEKMDNVWNINPSLNPKSLSSVLHAIGSDIEGQQAIFSHLSSQASSLIYDLTAIFSRSMTLKEAEKGYNAKHRTLPQINLALFCDIESRLPTMIRALPGSLKDVSTLDLSLKELDLKNTILVLDRGFVSESLIETFIQRNIDFVLPMRRNSTYYETRFTLPDLFTFKKRLIHGGKLKLDHFFIYRFKDEDLALEERKTVYQDYLDKKISKEECDEALILAGQIVILSPLDRNPQDIYELYKSRDLVEKHFDTFKNELEADKLCLQDSDALLGHAFIGFLSLYFYCKILNIIKKAELNSRYSPIDVLIKFSKVYRVIMNSTSFITEVPKKVRTLEKKLDLQLFPK